MRHVYDTTKDAIVRAMIDTYHDLEARDQAPPSRAVQVAAMGVVGRGEITMRRALTFDVPSESEPGRVHVVALYLKLRRDRVSEAAYRSSLRTHQSPLWRNDIVGARCSCPNRAEVQDPPATGGHPPCKHILSALALARVEGYRLEVPS
jgi:hypothetical protein